MRNLCRCGAIAVGDGCWRCSLATDGSDVDRRPFAGVFPIYPVEVASGVLDGPWYRLSDRKHRQLFERIGRYRPVQVDMNMNWWGTVVLDARIAERAPSMTVGMVRLSRLSRPERALAKVQIDWVGKAALKKARQRAEWDQYQWAEFSPAPYPSHDLVVVAVRTEDDRRPILTILADHVVALAGHLEHLDLKQLRPRSYTKFRVPFAPSF